MDISLFFFSFFFFLSPFLLPPFFFRGGVGIDDEDAADMAEGWL